MAVHRGADLGDVRPRKPQRKRRGLLPRLPRVKHWRAVRRYGTRAVRWSAFAALMGGMALIGWRIAVGIRQHDRDEQIPEHTF